ncbi:PTS sugar transporter subunit IIA [Virgibacillus pantothenticus]|uniref:PTS sugar transporter subunit IIA n=1 Tax=Virgibacillus pantothenticus TaxID=1473 RepID=UPI0009854687|nr:PTS sugar transporter subunit IIA [Virgibacillus pantothenticus]
MKTIILISHGSFCEGLKESVEMILGSQEQIKTVSLLPEEDGSDFLKKFDSVIAEIDGDYVVFADLLGGTPANVISSKIMSGESIEVYVGMNMPMIITYLNSQMLGEPFDLNKSKENMVDLTQHIKEKLK